MTKEKIIRFLVIGAISVILDLALLSVAAIVILAGVSFFTDIPFSFVNVLLSLAGLVVMCRLLNKVN